MKLNPYLSLFMGRGDVRYFNPRVHTQSKFPFSKDFLIFLSLSLAFYMRSEKSTGSQEPEEPVLTPPLILGKFRCRPHKKKELVSCLSFLAPKRENFKNKVLIVFVMNIKL